MLLFLCYRSEPHLQILRTRMWRFAFTELTGPLDLSIAAWSTLTCNRETADCSPMSEKKNKEKLNALKPKSMSITPCVFFFCEWTSAELLSVRNLSAVKQFAVGSKHLDKEQLRFMNPLREVDSEGVL